MRLRPTKLAAGLAAGSLILFGVGTNVQAGWVIVLSALLAGAGVAGGLFALRAVSGIDVERRAPAFAAAGDPVPVELVVRNTRRRSAGAVLLVDAFAGRGTAVVAHLAAGAVRSFRDVRPGARRGVHEGGRCEVMSGAPFGVIEVRRRIDVPSRIVVYPRVFRMRGDADAGDARRPRYAEVGDTASVRPYRPGDPLRRVHWRSTARRAELVVREPEQPSRAELVVAAATPADERVLDAIASVACTVAIAAMGRGTDVRMACARDGKTEVLRAFGRDAVLDWGARLAPDDLPLEAVVCAANGEAAIVCVTGAGAESAGVVDALRVQAGAGRDVRALVVGGDAGAPSPEASRIAESLRSAGVRASAVPATEDLGPWLGAA